MLGFQVTENFGVLLRGEVREGGWAFIVGVGAVVLQEDSHQSVETVLPTAQYL